MKRLLVAAAANYVALHGRRTRLAFAAATSTDHSRHPAEPVDPPPVRITALPGRVVNTVMVVRAEGLLLERGHHYPGR